MRAIKYDFAYMFIYSERPKTLAERKFTDDISEEIKKNRLTEIINIQQQSSMERNKNHIGKVHEVLIEGTSKRSDDFLQGRNSQNAVVVFPRGNKKVGEYVNVLVNDCTAATLIGEIAD